MRAISDKYGKTLYSPGDELFEKKAPMERILSANFKELVLDFSTDMSYRSAENRLNRIRWQETGISYRTICNIVEREGKAMEAALESKSRSIFETAGFTPDGLPPEGHVMEKPAFKPMDPEEVEEAAEILGLDQELNLSDYECPDSTANISMDDVLTKKQASERTSERTADGLFPHSMRV